MLHVPSVFFQFPTIFTLGFFTKGDIAKDEMDDVEFITTLVGEGWKEKLTEPSDQHLEPPNKKMTLVVSINLSHL